MPDSIHIGFSIWTGGNRRLMQCDIMLRTTEGDAKIVAEARDQLKNQLPLVPDGWTDNDSIVTFGTNSPTLKRLIKKALDEAVLEDRDGSEKL